MVVGGIVAGVLLLLLLVGLGAVDDCRIAQVLVSLDSHQSSW